MGDNSGAAAVGKTEEELSKQEMLILDAWDPMGEMFNNVVANRYYDGPAAGLAGHASKEQTSENNRVYVLGLPVEFSENHIRSLFRSAGEAREVYILPIRTGERDERAACLLTFSSRAEQMDAIKMYNNHTLTDEHVIKVRAAKPRK